MRDEFTGISFSFRFFLVPASFIPSHSFLLIRSSFFIWLRLNKVSALKAFNFERGKSVMMIFTGRTFGVTFRIVMDPKATKE